MNRAWIDVPTNIDWTVREEFCESNDEEQLTRQRLEDSLGELNFVLHLRVEHDDLSLRTIAAAAGIDPSTVSRHRSRQFDAVKSLGYEYFA